MANLIIGQGVKMAAAGIGLASESIKHHRAKRTASKNQKVGESGNVLQDSPNTVLIEEQHAHFVEDDDRFWELDAVQEQLATTDNNDLNATNIRVDQVNRKERNIDEIIDAFVLRHPLTSEQSCSLTYLPLPVVLPQRRPKDRSRGFVRAYAPVLENAAIDQACFLDFLETFEVGIRASPWLHAINFATLAGLALPTGASIALSVACMLAIKAAANVQNRTRGNELLSKANLEFFQPRGLFCLIMTWNPDSDMAEESLDLVSKVASIQTTYTGGTMIKTMHNLRRSDGKSSEAMIPESAPLVFPGLDALDDATGDQAKNMKAKLKRSKEFVGNYFDMRASAKYAAKHPESALVQGPKPEFRSRYSDPNHPASNGHIISLLSGGKINPPSIGASGINFGHGLGRGQSVPLSYLERRLGIRNDTSSESRNVERGSNIALCGRGHGHGESRGFVSLLPPVNKLLKKNVMYLLIVNMPTDEEILAAQAVIE